MELKKIDLKRYQPVSDSVLYEPTKTLRHAYVELAKEQVLDILQYD